MEIMAYRYILVCLAISSATFANVPPPIAKVSQGELRGIYMTSRSGRNFSAFLGIPYAAPPIGDRRFKAPEPPGPFTGGVHNATRDGPMCIQKNHLDAKPVVQGQEDCLYLNVYTPKVKDAALDVMVYIHGGGFFSGTGASFLWGPQFLLDRDIVLVTFNYRLGSFGFLSTNDDVCPGNFGLKDQVAALKWVQQNIAALGGNPKSVTIFGQSAGATSVHLHMMSPLSKGLFHKAISQSGTALAPYAWPSDSLSVAKRQAEVVGCDPETDTATMISCLRKVDPTVLTDSVDKLKPWSIDPLVLFTPAIEHGSDGFLTADPYYLVKNGRFQRVPWIQGVVSDEGIIRGLGIMKNATLLQDLNTHLDVLGPWLTELFKSTTNKEQETYVWSRIVSYFLGEDNPVTIGKHNERGFLNMYSDRSFIHSFHKAAQLHQRAQHENIYLYHIDYRGKNSFTQYFANTSEDYGVSHCDDLTYLFQIPLFSPTGWTEDDLRVSHTIINFWTNFAKHGQPISTPLNDNNLPLEQFIEVPEWNTIGADLRYLNIGPGPTFQMKQQLYKERMDFWDSLPLTENDPYISIPLYLIDLLYKFIAYVSH